MRPQRTVAGIDIGGERKGNHLVIMRGTKIVWNNHLRETPGQMLEKCIEFEVAAVGIDAPCQWRLNEAGRHAEKLLTKQRIFSFATPTRDRASESMFYDWMFNGERVYNAFAEKLPLFNGAEEIGDRICFETSPHAITCALLGREVASAKQKKTQRRRILRDAGIETKSLRSIDKLMLCCVPCRKFPA